MTCSTDAAVNEDIVGGTMERNDAAVGGPSWREFPSGKAVSRCCANPTVGWGLGVAKDTVLIDDPPTVAWASCAAACSRGQPTRHGRGVCR